MTTTPDDYLLGHGAAELDRLEHQAAMLAPATRALLTMAGIEPGMRVLDLGTGPGDVALIAGELVGPDGAVVGIDRSADAVASARARASRRGVTNVTFTVGDVHDHRDEAPFDAVVGRLVLLYTSDPVAVVRQHLTGLRPGGLVLAMEYDMPAARTVPPSPLTDTAIGWLLAAFAHAGLDTVLGARLESILRAAGCRETRTIGIQPYLDAEQGAALVAGIVRTLSPVIEQAGIATDAELDAPTLAGRLAADMREHGAVLAPPTLVGAWMPSSAAPDAAP